MQIRVISFGKIAGITGPDVSVKNVTDTDSLRALLEESYPALKETKYVIAVNKDLVRDNKPLQAGSEVALLPPFSGG